jgi:predicted metalloprotease
MELNENAGLDTSQVEDMRGSPGRGSGGPGGLGGLFPSASGGAAGRGGGLGSLIPGLGGKGSGGIIGLLLLGLVACLCFGGGKLGGFGSFGDLGGLGATGTNDSSTVNNTDIAQTCSTTNPDRFNNEACRNLLYVNSIQSHWQTALPQDFGVSYQAATTRYFSGQVSTACGPATSGVGPFYCPGDNHVYIDLAFYQELANRFGASGQFAQAYVLAHEYGHHIQSLLGIEPAMRRAQQRDPGNANQYSVLLELQADCFAGVWANHATRTADANGQPLFKSLTTQDIQDALNAAAAVGDDAIQRKSGVAINEAAFTHGSSQQREQWTYQGYTTGDPKRCNTFGNSLS